MRKAENENSPINNNDRRVVDLSLLERENGIPFEMMQRVLSWERPLENLSAMDLAHRFKRTTGFEQFATLVALMGKYAKTV